MPDHPSVTLARFEAAESEEDAGGRHVSRSPESSSPSWWPHRAPGRGARRVEDADLRARIEAQLAALPDRDDAEIRAAVRDGQALLLGRVRGLEQSLRAEQAAWKTPGVLDVDNELHVVPHGVGGDAAIERPMREIIEALRVAHRGLPAAS